MGHPLLLVWFLQKRLRSLKLHEWPERSIAD
jgi:hypothetical protein